MHAARSSAAEITVYIHAPASLAIHALLGPY